MSLNFDYLLNGITLFFCNLRQIKFVKSRKIINFRYIIKRGTW